MLEVRSSDYFVPSISKILNQFNAFISKVVLYPLINFRTRLLIHQQDAQPCMVVSLWKARLERRNLYQSDPTLTIVDDSTSNFLLLKILFFFVLQIHVTTDDNFTNNCFIKRIFNATLNHCTNAII